GDHFRVFTPYWNRWRRTALRPLAPTPEHVALPPGLLPGRLSRLEELTEDMPSPDLLPGGEKARQVRLAAWVRQGGAGYSSPLETDATSHLSPYLHFGCISAREIVARLQGRAGAEAFLRQLCWRDFYHQVSAAFPRIATTDYRPRGDRWRNDRRGFAA